MEIPKSFVNETIKQLITKPPTSRTQHDNDYLYYHFIHFPFFTGILQSNNNNLGDLMYRSIINCMSFKTYQPGTSIYKPNDAITSMYIIIDGSVNVYKKPSKKHKQHIPKPNTRSLSYNSFKLGMKQLLSYTIYKELDVVLQMGTAFGHEHFSNGTKRVNLVEAKTHCILAEISRYDYMIIFKKTAFLERLTAFNFLSNINAFKHTDNPRIIELLYSKMHLIKYKNKDYIIKQHQPFIKLFIVKRGRFKVIKTHHITFKSTLNDNYLNNVTERGNERFTLDRAFELKSEYVDKWRMELMIYEKGEIIGDIEYLFNQQQYMFSIQCDEDNSEIFELNVNEFNTIVNDKFIKVFKDNISYKLHQMKQCIVNIKANPLQQKQHQNKYNNVVINNLRRLQEHKSLHNISHKPKHKQDNNNTTTTTNIYEVVYSNSSNKYKKLKYRAKSAYNCKTMNKISYKPFRLVNEPIDKTVNNNKQEETTIQTNYINEESLSKRKYKNNNNGKRSCSSSKRMFIPILQYTPNFTDSNNNNNKSATSLRIQTLFTNHKKKKLSLKHINEYKTTINNNNEVPTTHKTIASTRILNEHNNKSNYSNCLEVNKYFFINNNTSILKKKNELTEMFNMNTNNNNNNNLL